MWYLYLSGLSVKCIKVTLYVWTIHIYCTLKLRHAAAANGKNVKIVPYRNPFSLPLVAEAPAWPVHKTNPPTRPLAHPHLRGTKLDSPFPFLKLGKRTSISTCGPTRFWDFWSHTHQRSHTPQPYPTYPTRFFKATNTWHAFRVKYKISERIVEVTNQIFTGMRKKF